MKVTSCLVLTKAVKQPGLTSHHAAFRVGEFEVAISGGIWVAIRVNFEFLIEEGYISAQDVQLFTLVDTVEEIIATLQNFYGGNPPAHDVNLD